MSKLCLQASTDSSSTIQLLGCFSVIRNKKSLMQDLSSSENSFVYFLKVFFMCIVINGHRGIANGVYPRQEIEENSVSLTIYAQTEGLGGKPLPFSVKKKKVNWKIIWLKNFCVVLILLSAPSLAPSLPIGYLPLYGTDDIAVIYFLGICTFLCLLLRFTLR